MKQLFQRLFARKPSAQTEAAEDSRQAEATEARDNAAQALNAEAQAVVDRIRERTVKIIPNDPPSVIKVEATLSDAAGNTVAAKPVRKRKPKGDDQ